MNEVDCVWGEWQIGGIRKCPPRGENRCKGNRHDIRDMVQGAMYGGKQCTGSHERVCHCCYCPGNIFK